MAVPVLRREQGLVRSFSEHPTVCFDTWIDELQAATCSGRSGNFTTYRVVKLVSELKMPAGSDVKRFSCKSLPQNHSASTINQET